MPEDVMLQEAIEAIRQGQRARARDLLTRLLRTDQSNPEYWLWMSSVVDTYKEQVYCLQNVIRLDAKNSAAQQGLVLLGATVPEKEVVPAPPVRRKWTVETREVPELRGLKAVWANPIARLVILVVATLALFGLLSLGILGLTRSVRRPTQVVIIPTSTAGPTPTFTYTPTPRNFTAVAPTATPRFSGPPPLESLLDATYTPTPIYVNTPHPANESYSIAQRALQRGDLKSALDNLRLAQQMEPNAADIAFLMGEIYLQDGNYREALSAYDEAIGIDANFAPAYLGKVRARLVQNPKTDISRDLNAAIEKAPDYGEAYLQRATYRLSKGDVEGAQADLEIAAELLPNSPLVYLYRAQLELENGEMEAAWEDARRANQLDKTLLLSYRLLAEAAAANGDLEEAGKALDVYLTYEEGDAQAYIIQGQVLFANEAYSETLEALDKAIELDKALTDIYQVRGLTYLALDQGQKAVNDLFIVLQTDTGNYHNILNFARALLSAGRLSDALSYVNRAYNISKTDEQRAAALFWRAQTLERIGNLPSALKDWKTLLELPEEAVLEEYRTLAESRLEATATPAPTATNTPRVTPTPTATRTPRLSATPTTTATSKPSATPIATTTSTATATTPTSPTSTGTP